MIFEIPQYEKDQGYVLSLTLSNYNLTNKTDD